MAGRCIIQLRSVAFMWQTDVTYSFAFEFWDSMHNILFGLFFSLISSVLLAMFENFTLQNKNPKINKQSKGHRLKVVAVVVFVYVLTH